MSSDPAGKPADTNHRIPAVQLTGVQKIYGPVRVLNIDDLALQSGQVVALVGENGAGKSTLMGSLAGTVTPDLGRIAVNGCDIELGSPAASMAAGIAMVSQEFPLVGELSVGENLFLGVRPPGTRAGVIDFTALHRSGQQLLDGLGLKLGRATPARRDRQGLAARTPAAHPGRAHLRARTGRGRARARPRP